MRSSVRSAMGLSALVLVALALGGCGPMEATPAADAVRVVATTTVFADLVVQVGGDDVSVKSLVPAGGEPHTFDPRPSDVTAFADADLVVMNGLGLDDWVLAIMEDAGSTAPVIRLGEDLPGANYLSTDGAVNPHLWLNVQYTEAYVDRITSALTQAAPDKAGAFQNRASAYRGELEALNTYAENSLGQISADRRKIVSFHDAFPYFAQAYGLEIIGVVVAAPGQDPSASDVAELIDAIAASGASAIVSEDQFPTDLVDEIAAETGVTVVSDLYTDSLGDPPGDSYLGMIRWDVDRLVAALR